MIMLDEKLMQRIVDYLDGKLDQEGQEQLQNELATKGFDLTELTDLEKLSTQLDRLPKPQPSEEMSEKFYRRLDQSAYSVKQTFWQGLELRRRAPQIAYAMLLVIFGFILGNWARDDSSYRNELFALSSDVRQMKQVVSLTLIQHPSPVERLKAINDMSHAPLNGHAIINVLLHTFNTDPNTNVRLAALDALQSYIGEPEVWEGLIQAYAFQRSPIVQLALTDLMVKSGEREAAQSIQMLLRSKDLNVIVRQKLEQSLNKLI
jgi:hypothetical protein